MAPKRKLGMPPMIDAGTGENLAKYAVKFFPRQWKWLARKFGDRERCAALRALVDEERRRNP